jgi:hypothetical protein
LIFVDFDTTINCLIYLLNKYIQSGFASALPLTSASFIDKKFIKQKCLEKGQFSFKLFKDCTFTPSERTIYENTKKLFVLFNPSLFNISKSKTFYNTLYKQNPIGYLLPKDSSERIYNYIIAYLLNEIIKTKYYYLDLNHDIKSYPEPSGASGGSNLSLKKIKKNKMKTNKKIKTHGGSALWRYMSKSDPQLPLSSVSIKKSDESESSSINFISIMKLITIVKNL